MTMTGRTHWGGRSHLRLQGRVENAVGKIRIHLAGHVTGGVAAHAVGKHRKSHARANRKIGDNRIFLLVPAPLAERRGHVIV